MNYKRLILLLLVFIFCFNNVSAATEPGQAEIYLYSAIFGIILLLLFLGHYIKQYQWIMFAAFLLIAVGLYTFINGGGYDLTFFEAQNQTGITDDFTNWSSVGNGWIFWNSWALVGLGIYLFIAVAYTNALDLRRGKGEEE